MVAIFPKIDVSPDLTAGAETLAENVLAGKAIGTNAPFLLLQADGEFAEVAQHAGLRLEEDNTLLTDSGSDVALTVTVSTPAWAAVDTVEFYINNQPELTSEPGAAARCGICPNMQISAGDPGWVVVMARGTDGVSEPLFPTLPASLSSETNTTVADLTDGNLGEGGTSAFAFTNPLLIDVNGDGWSAPGVASALYPRRGQSGISAEDPVSKL